MISSHQNNIERMIKWTRQIFSLGKCWNQTLVKVLDIPVNLLIFHPSEMFSSLLCLTLTSLILRKRKFQTHKLLGKCLVVSNQSESNPPYNYIRGDWISLLESYVKFKSFKLGEFAQIGVYFLYQPSTKVFISLLLQESDPRMQYWGRKVLFIIITIMSLKRVMCDVYVSKPAW